MRVSGCTYTKDHHSKDREPPFPLYLGLKIHTQTRSKKLVKCLHKAGLSVSYSRVIEIENSLAATLCKRFEQEGLVCPANLRKDLFTVGALDNIDHNTSSTTAKGALHGTAMSIFQFPTLSNPGVCREPIVIVSGDSHKFSLPDQYTCVPAVSCKTDQLHVSEYIDPDSISSCLDNAKAGVAGWVKQGIELLAKNKLGSKEYISWAAYHASLLPSPVDPSSLIALLPLFYEKAATVAMVKHGMDIQQQITEYLNPGQIPVTAFDQPLFTLAKYVQWHWPDSLGEKCHVVMFGGLHVEMALWNTIGDFLESSGWTTALCESEVASSGTADSFLNATHLTRTTHAHQVTALALSVLQNDAWQQQSSSNGDASFETWRKNMIEKSPTFQFWDIVLRYEILVLIFIRAHHTQNFDLYVETLEALVPWFFALDHTNYARWVPVHINVFHIASRNSSRAPGLFKKLRKSSPTSLLTKLTSRIIKM